MANGMGSLYIGASGLQNSQNALNTTANNLANVDTKGYVRQQVLFADRGYVTFDRKASISNQQAGLGLDIADVVHTRNFFLDQYYRTENGRQAFYEACSLSSTEVQTMFQELEGEQFQQTIEEFWTSFEELYTKGPAEEVAQNLVVQKATLFLDRSRSIYNNLKSYQEKLNITINETIDRINELGHTIQNLNQQILKIECGGVETAMTLRDERDNALDELSSLAKVEFKEAIDGTVRVKLEDVEFVDELNVYEVLGVTDPVTGFVNPIWPQLSDMGREQYTSMFNFKVDISTPLNTDIGKLKGLVLSRGDKVATYRDITGLTQQQYEDSTGMTVVMNSEAELDQMLHELATAIHDILSPLTRASFVGADGTVYNNVRVWDEENGCLGADGQKPGRELFVRSGCDRYTKVTGMDNKVYYVYNEEDRYDTSKMYCIKGMEINPDLLTEESALPHLLQNGEPSVEMAKKLVDIWNQKVQTINPSNTDPCTFKEYYRRMILDVASMGSVYEGMSQSLTGEVESIENNRQQVFGVSADEELQNMIKYQNAYNASSRFINVISEMLEHLVTRL